MRITNGGNVGIGTTSPTELLHVTNGYILVGIDKGIKFDTSGASGHPELSIDSNAALSFKNTAGSTNVIITNGGNVGIGTTSPLGKLYIGSSGLSNTGDASDALNIKQSSTTAATGIYLERSGERKGYYIYVGGSVDSLTFQRNNAGTKADVMSLTRDGNVGIGTTSPAATLHVVGTLRVTDTLSWASGDGVNWYIQGQANGPTIRMKYDGGSTNRSGALGWVDNAGTRYETLTWQDQTAYFSGNVGIGNTSPNMKLVVTGASGAAGDTGIVGITDGTGVNTDTKINFGVVSGTYGWIQAVKPGTDVLRLLLNPNGGNVGIGTTNPAYKLDVSGTIRATGDVIAYSDARVKENVETISDALAKVTSLRGVSYTRKDSEDKSRKVGVIAQEVLDILPEVVQQDIEGNYSVAYGNVVGVLIEAIKELKAEINELKNK
jgi:hypothetical protein